MYSILLFLNQQWIRKACGVFCSNLLFRPFILTSRLSDHCVVVVVFLPPSTPPAIFSDGCAQTSDPLHWASCRPLDGTPRQRQQSQRSRLDRQCWCAARGVWGSAFLHKASGVCKETLTITDDIKKLDKSVKMDKMLKRKVCRSGSHACNGQKLVANQNKIGNYLNSNVLP